MCKNNVWFTGITIPYMFHYFFASFSKNRESALCCRTLNIQHKFISWEHRNSKTNQYKYIYIIAPNILDAVSVCCSIWCNWLISIQTKWCHSVKFLWYQVWQEYLLTPLLPKVNSVPWMPPSFDPTHLSIHTPSFRLFPILVMFSNLPSLLIMQCLENKFFKIKTSSSERFGPLF